MKTLYTNCPVDYDGFSTRTVGIVGQTGRGPLREVRVEDRDFDWQYSRYASGGVFETSDRADFPAFLRRIGKLTDSPTPLIDALAAAITGPDMTFEQARADVVEAGRPPAGPFE